MLERKLWGLRMRNTGGWGLRAALVAACLILLFTAGQGLAMAESSGLKQAQLNGMPAALGQELANIRSLEDILRIAVGNNQSIKIAEMSIEEALAGGREVSAALRPQLSLAGQYVRENVANNSMLTELGLPAETPIPKDLLEDQLTSTVGTFTYYQQLGPTAQIRGLQKQTEIGTHLARLARDQALANTILAVQEEYFNVIRAYNNRLAALAAREHAKLNLATVERQLELGTATPLDALKERNALLEAENHLQMASTGLELAVMALLQNMGLAPIDAETALAWGAQLAQGWEGDIIPWGIHLEEAYTYALEHKLELAMARKQLEMAESAYKAVKEERDWTITLAGRYQPEDDIILNSSIDSNLTLMASATKLDVELPEIDPSKLYGAPGGSYDWRQQDTGYGSGEATKVNPWQIELSFSYRFGDGGARQAKIDAKEAAIEKAKLQVEMAENGCYLELYSCLQQLDQALRAYELAVESQRAARETLEQLEAMYERGSVTAKEVREGRLLVIQAQNRVVDAAFAYEAAKAKLAAAMGAAPDALIAALGRNQWDALMDN